MRKQYGMDGALETLKNNLPRWLEQTSEIPTLVHEILSQQARPLTKLQQIEKAKADKLKAKQQNKKIYAILASGFGIISALLYSLTTDGTQYFGMSIPTILALVITVVFVFKAIKN